MSEQFGPLLYTISIWALPAIIAITFHEAAHGFAARMLGDDTAWRLGRVTFNPLKHIDPALTAPTSQDDPPLIYNSFLAASILSLIERWRLA